MTAPVIPSQWAGLGLGPWLADSSALTRTLRAAGVAVPEAVRALWRLKPGPSALATLLPASPAADSWPHGYLLWLDRERLAATLEKALAMHPVSDADQPGVVALPDLGALYFSFPNDRHLRATKHLVDRDKLKRLLAQLPGLEGRRVRGRKTELHPIRYKPERRFLMRTQIEHVGPEATDPVSESLFLRFFTDERGLAIDALLRNLTGSALSHLVPAPMGTLLEGRLQVERALAGAPATLALREGRLEVPSVVHLLQRLREAPSAGLAPILGPTLMRETAAMLEILGGAGAADAGEISVVEGRLLALAPDREGREFVHGDLHLGQCLLRGRSLQVIDFERTGAGDGAQDLGNLLATLQAWRLEEATLSPKIQAFEERLLAACAREGLLRESLPFFQARALLELATLPIRRLHPEWPTLARALFLAARASLP